MKIEIGCQKAKHDAQMRVRCEALGGGLCAHQRFKSCKGWWVCTDQAGACPARTSSGADAPPSPEGKAETEKE